MCVCIEKKSVQGKNTHTHNEYENQKVFGIFYELRGAQKIVFCELKKNNIFHAYIIKLCINHTWVG